ncbi:MAG: hypothetical protein WBB98_11305 [Xanthobacteraceae bacterium]
MGPFDILEQPRPAALKARLRYRIHRRGVEYDSEKSLTRSVNEVLLALVDFGKLRTAAVPICRQAASSFHLNSISVTEFNSLVAIHRHDINETVPFSHTAVQRLGA